MCFGHDRDAGRVVQSRREDLFQLERERARAGHLEAGEGVVEALVRVLGLGIEHLVPRELDVVDGDRLPVGPEDVVLQLEGDRELVVADLVGLREVVLVFQLLVHRQKAGVHQADAVARRAVLGEKRLQRDPIAEGDVDERAALLRGR